MPQIVDLTRTRNKYADSSQAIGNILNTIGKVERLRQERALNAKVLNVIAQSGGNVDPREIARVLVEAEPQYDAGPVGFLQKIANKFAPPSPMVTGAAQQAAQGALDPYTQARIGYYENAKAQQAEYKEHQTKMQLADRYMRLANSTFDMAYDPETTKTDPELLKKAEGYRQRAESLLSGGSDPPVSRTPPPAAAPAASKKAEKTIYDSKTKKVPPHKLSFKSAEDRLDMDAEYARLKPEEATESYRQFFEGLGYSEEDLAELLEVFKQGKKEKIKTAIKRIGRY